MAHNTRRVYARLQFEGAEITTDPECSLLSLTYTDAEESKTDDLQFVLEDRDLIWAGNWLDGRTLSKGAKAEAQIIVEDGGGSSILQCGTFEVDSVSLAGPPTKVTIKATSLPYKSGLRTEKKSRSWEEYSLSGIGAEIAAGGGMTLEYLTNVDPYFETREQVEQSDATFLQVLVLDAGLVMKVSQNKIIIYDKSLYESQSPVCVLTRTGGEILSYSFDTDTLGASYSKAVCKYVDPETGDVIEGVYQPADADTDMPVLRLDSKAETVEEAEANAKAAYENALRNKFTFSMDVIGDPMYLVGTNVEVSGFGSFDGKYAIESARHSLSGKYVTSISGYRI